MTTGRNAADAGTTGERFMAVGAWRRVPLLLLMVAGVGLPAVGEAARCGVEYRREGECPRPPEPKKRCEYDVPCQEPVIIRSEPVVVNQPVLEIFQPVIRVRQAPIRVKNPPVIIEQPRMVVNPPPLKVNPPRMEVVKPAVVLEKPDVIVHQAEQVCASPACMPAARPVAAAQPRPQGIIQKQ